VPVEWEVVEIHRTLEFDDVDADFAQVERVLLLLHRVDLFLGPAEDIWSQLVTSPLATHGEVSSFSKLIKCAMLYWGTQMEALSAEVRA